jgi:hypothetical protein
MLPRDGESCSRAAVGMRNWRSLGPMLACVLVGTGRSACATQNTPLVARGKQGTRLEWGCGACYFRRWPGVAELADAADSKSAGALLCVGSTPSSGTNFSASLRFTSTSSAWQDLNG